MTIYWLLLAFPALMALFAPSREDAEPFGAGTATAVLFVILFYGLISLLRYDIGGDWATYQAMYDRAYSGTFGEALSISDPGFSLLLFVSAKLGWGIYPVNAICSLILVFGVLRVALTTKEPWLALTAAVPYILIVVGLGYVRQAAAIGFILVAIAAVGEDRPLKTVILLALALVMHSTSITVWPFFAWALANRNKLGILLLTTAGSAGFLALAAARYSSFEAGYIDAEYESSGTFVRLLMSLLPSAVLIARYRYFGVPERARTVWLGFAVANVAALLLLGVLSSSTAIDRTSLYFACVQVIVFGELARLLHVSVRTNIVIRLIVIGYSIAVQLVWLVYATHSNAWVPYKSLLQFL